MKMDSKLADICTFRLGGNWYGINVLDVQEVIRDQQLTDVPLATSSIEGLINLRGEIVTAIDLRQLFQYADPPSDEDSVFIIVSISDGKICLRVDEIGDVRDGADIRLEQAEASWKNKQEDFVTSAVPFSDRTVLLIDVQKLFAQTLRASGNR